VTSSVADVILTVGKSI